MHEIMAEIRNIYKVFFRKGKDHLEDLIIDGTV
jgi:hypothetical protein